MNGSMNVGEIELELVEIRENWSDLPAEAAERWLTPAEHAAYRRFPTPKRRREWFAGRLAAKRLLARRLEAKGHPTGLDGIEVGNDPTGMPLWTLLGPRPSGVKRWTLSISHSGAWAAAALHPGEGRLGMDLEKVEPRDPAWLDIAFHEEERRPELAADPALATRLWTIKEAALKALGVGLGPDLWDLRAAADGSLKMHGRVLERARELGLEELKIDVRELEDYILTVAWTPSLAGAASA